MCQTDQICIARAGERDEREVLLNLESKNVPEV